MTQYHKIHSLFKRDPATKYKTFLMGEWARPEFGMLQDISWLWTEKIDGTNIRVMRDESGVHFGGKTNRAQLYVPLYDRLNELFTLDKFDKALDYDSVPITLYGEGYGARIQKAGSLYIPDGVDFILFDIKIGNIWLKRQSVVVIAGELNIETAPIVGLGTLWDAMDFVEKGFTSVVSQKEQIAEGVVLRPEHELLDRMGRRIITKLKHKDFQNKEE